MDRLAFTHFISRSSLYSSKTEYPKPSPSIFIPKKIGNGVLLDHATGVDGDNVSILHSVTLGGTGKQCGDRHPKISDGVLIGARSCVLGNIVIGEGAKIGSGSVVLKDVPPRTTAVGNPATLIGGREDPRMVDKIPGLTMDQTSYLTEWSDYVI